MKITSVISLLAAGMLCHADMASAQTNYKKALANYDNGIANKWEFRVGLGGSYGTRGDKAGLFDLGLGYNIGSNVYLGIATGAYPLFGVVDDLKADVVLPLMGDLTWRYNTSNEKVSFFIEGRGGVLVHSRPTAYLEIDDQDNKYERQPYLTIEVGPGLDIRVRRNIDLRLSVGYAYANPTNDGFVPARNYTEHSVQARVGFAFRGEPRTASRSVLRDAVLREERERQMQQYLAEQKAEEEAALRRAEEDREERRRRREEMNQTIAQQGGSTVDPMAGMAQNTNAYEFFFHVTPKMIADGAGLENKLIQLASLAAGKHVSSIVVMGYAPASPDGSPNVVDAMAEATKVINYLNKRYVIDKTLFSSAFNGFEASSGASTKPKDAIATIMIQRVSEK